MPDIASNIKDLKKNIPPSVTVIAVSKTKPVSDILKAYETGHRDFGENRVQELLSKKDLLPPDIRWHLIGHLQTNKVKFIAPFINLIHSVDSFRLLKSIDNEAVKIERVIRCLLQFHIAEEETKFGFSLPEAIDMLKSEGFSALHNVQICGVMGMATFIDNDDQVRTEFRKLKQYFLRLKADFFSGQDSFREISMGMSGDYKTAIEEGSTMIRTGSVIFGSRI